MDFERLGREPDHALFARFPPHFKFKVTNVMLLFQNRQCALAIRRIAPESEVDRAFSDHLIPVIAGERDEAIVNFKNDTVRETDNGETIRTRAEGFCET